MHQNEKLEEKQGFSM